MKNSYTVDQLQQFYDYYLKNVDGYGLKVNRFLKLIRLRELNLKCRDEKGRFIKNPPVKKVAE